MLGATEGMDNKRGTLFAKTLNECGTKRRNTILDSTVEDQKMKKNDTRRAQRIDSRTQIEKRLITGTLNEDD